MKLNKLAARGMAGLTLLCVGLVQAEEIAEVVGAADDARQVTQQTRERDQARIHAGEEMLTAEQVRQRDKSQGKQREQARQQLEQRLNSGQYAGNSGVNRGDDSRERTGSTRFGQGYESRKGGGHHSGSGGAGGRR
jgi:hypothetical protein